MGLRLCLLVLALAALVSGISRTPSDVRLNPVLLEAEQISPNCVLTLTTPGSCTAPTAPSGGWKCGINCDSATQNNPGWCQVNTTTTNQYRYISKTGCTCDNCPTTIVPRVEACRAQTRCVCYINGVAQSSCTQSNLCAGAPCPSPTPVLPQCPLGDWSAWGPCIDSATGMVAACDYEWGLVGAGIQSRYRDPVRSSSCSGGPVRQTETKQCTADCPPMDCVQTPWMTTQPCPACWDRTVDPLFPPMEVQWSYISQHPMFGGAPCNCPWYFGGNECQQPVDCNIAVCPTDCVVSDWEEWCPCDKSCVDTRADCRNCVGLQYRIRHVLVQPQNGGKSCPELRETRSCNEQPCPIDCQMSTWTPWSQCSSKCGGGQQLRTRYIMLSSQYNGTACGDLYEYQICNTEPCPVSCQVSTWGDWDVTCPRCIQEGASPTIRTRHRSIVVNPSNNGADCPPLEESEQCPIYYCPIDCQYTPWTDWSDCTVTCGGGVQTRKRTILRPASYGGVACVDQLFESRTCNIGECPRDCVYFWGPWHSTNENGADCSAPCGGGTQQHEIQIVVQPNALGRACPPSPEIQPCNTLCCPQDCLVSEYDVSVEQCQSSLCPSTCGIGFCERKRTVVSPASCGGAACPPLSDWVPCKLKDCEETCLWSEWSGWSVCPSCGASSPDIKRFREKKLLQGNPAVCGGDQSGNSFQEEACVLAPCPIDCQMSGWTTDPCSVTCGVGYQRKTRTIEVRNAYGGVRCPHTVEFEACVRPACVPDCLLSDWSAWGPCSATCQAAGATVPYQERHRTILIHGNGADCNAPLSESSPCNAIPCPVHCILSDWSQWSPSPCGWVDGVQRCGLNLQTRHRDIIQYPANGGRICQITEDQQYCDAGPCEHPCEFTPWSEWSFPSATCGTAYRTRHRYLLNANGDTTNCPHLSERTQVTVPPCPVDCEFYYGNWTECSNEGFRRRHVFISVQASNGGRPCPTCQVERDDCTPPPSGVEECWLENCDEQ